MTTKMMGCSFVRVAKMSGGLAKKCIQAQKRQGCAIIALTAART